MSRSQRVAECSRPGGGRVTVAVVDRVERGKPGLNSDLLTPGEAGEYLKTGERFVRRLIAERRIGYVKVGKFVRLERGELDRFIAAGRVSARDSQP